MWIRQVVIKNFRSLRDVKMDDLGAVVSIVGENGSGKTNIVEGLRLIFGEFDAGLRRGCGERPTQLWYCERTDTPIELSVSLELTEEEVADLMEPGLLEALAPLDNAQLVTVRRHLTWHPMECEWTTLEVRIGNRFVVKDGKPTSRAAVSLSRVDEAPGEPQATGEEDPIPTEASQAPPEGGQASNDENESLNSGQPGEQLPPTHESTGGAQAVEQLTGTDKGSGEPSAEGESGQLSPAASAFLRSLADLIKGVLRVIPAVRSSPASVDAQAFEREPFISAEMQQELVTLHESRDRRDVAEMDRIEARLEAIWPQRWKLDFLGRELLVREEELRFPIALQGGGRQEYLGMVLRLREPGRVFLVEEPEAHLHSRLRKQLFEFMKQTSQSGQIFVASHSVDFLDLDDPTDSWVCKKVDMQTRVSRAETADDLMEALDLLGAEPADRLYPNNVLLVAGETEGVVLPIWLRTMGMQPDGLEIKVVPLAGEHDRRTVESWVERGLETQTEVFLMVDSHGEALVQRATQPGLPEQHSLVLDGTIEDCYPKEILEDELWEWYDRRYSRPDLNAGEPMVPQIKQVLKDRLTLPFNKTVWKKPIGEAVAGRMTEEQIPERVTELLDRLR